MSPPRVLISGASIAGPALAYWLIRAGCHVTVVERTPELRIEGQGVDIHDAARDVVKRMGIFDTLMENGSHEEGMDFIDGRNRTYARFGVDTSGKGQSMTCDIEILRGQLATILYELTKKDVEYVFGDMIESFEQTEKDITVSFAKGKPRATYDLVVAADGIGSKLRSMALGKGTKEVLRDLGAYVAYFSVPRTKSDDMFAKFRGHNGGRITALRPDNVGRTRVFFMQVARKGDPRLARFEKVAKEGIEAQKVLVHEMFQDADWQTSRLLKGMEESDDFYLQHVAQVKLDHWSNGRVTMVGDAGYAPSPFSGMGTSIAFIGAYILAGEISKQPDNIPAALESYERVLRPYAECVQELAPGVPWIFAPQWEIGVRTLETVIWLTGVLSRTGVMEVVFKMAEYLPFKFGKDFELPEYEAFKK